MLSHKKEGNGNGPRCVIEAFFELKKRLLSTPILSLPYFNRGFMVDTAASGEGLGAVLSGG